MQIKQGVILAGLDIRMRPALIAAERVWKEYGQPEGVTITCGLDGTHSAGSFHYYGLAVDCRTRYWDDMTTADVAQRLRYLLGGDFDVVIHSSHIHIEYDPTP